MHWLADSATGGMRNRKKHRAKQPTKHAVISGNYFFDGVGIVFSRLQRAKF